MTPHATEGGRTTPRGNRERHAGDVPGIAGGSAVAERLRSQVRKYAPAPEPVLVTGETGSGKEPVAKALHALSGCGTAPFVAVHAGAIASELFESEMFGHEGGAYTGAYVRRRGRIAAAQGGTLYLDEIGDLPPAQQVKLLRVLQDGEYVPVGANEPIHADFRLVCATNKDLRAAVQAGEFRADLYYRIAALVVEVPPLRERLDDIPDLIRGWARFSDLAEDRELVALLKGHSWPGNIRELQNVLAAAWCELQCGGAPAAAAAAALARSPLGTSTAGRILTRSYPWPELERANIQIALAECDGNITRAATDRLEMSRQGLVDKMDRLGIARPAAQKDIRRADRDSGGSGTKKTPRSS